MGGDVLQAARGRMGEILAREAPAPTADLVIAVPDSGNPAARGFARAAGLPQDDGIIKNRYVARTFIQPGQELRKHGLRLKFNPLPEIVGGRRLVVVDDSIVRGNTTRQIVQMLRDAGAAEVHMRISAPPIRNPCHYGIDMSTREEMIAHERTEAEVAAELGADSLAYLSLAGVYEACAASARATATPASRATTRWPAATRRAGSSRSSCRSCGPSALFAPPSRRHVAQTGGRHARVPRPAGRRYGRAPAHGRRPHRTANALRLRGLPPRPGRGRAGADAVPARPRRARRHAHGRGQVAVLPAAGADARRPDGGRLAARVADAGPGRGARARGARGAPRWSTPSRTPGPTAPRSSARPPASVRLLYVAPERFSSPGFAEALRAAHVGLFVVDEAHCVSQWGHDFRPDYFRLADAARWLGAQALVASTATATPQVAADIVARLGLRDPVRVTTGFDRPNLSFAVVPCRGAADKRARIAAALARATGRARPSSTRARARRPRTWPARWRARWGPRCWPTTPASARQERADAQRRFMDGEVEVVVATNAFGMGVDKADVRTVAHATVPGSVEAYYQEAGRAGRDGLPSRALLLRGEPRQGSARLLHRARRGRRRGARGGGRHAAARRGRRPLRPPGVGRRRSGARARARDRRPPRAGGRRASGAGPDRSAARARARPLRRTGARRRAGRRPGRPSAPAGASTARCGPSSRAPSAAARRSCATSAIAPQPHAEVPCCDVCAPELVPARARAPRPSPGALRPAISTRRSSTWSPAPSPRSGARGRSRSCAAGARRSCARTPTTGCPRTGRSPTCARTRCSARVDELLDAGRLVSTGGAFPKLRLGQAA